MAGIKEVLEIVSKKFGDDTLSEALKADDLSKVEFSDDVISQITEKASNLLTPDAALNNPSLIEKYKDSVHPTIKKSIYERVETDLKELGGKLGVSFEDGEQANDMLKKLKDFNLPAPEKGDTKKYTDEIDRLNSELAKTKESSKGEIDKLKKTYEQKELSNVIDRSLSKFKLAEAYDKDLVKKGIFENVKGELFSKAVVKVGENGGIELFQKDMPDKMIYTEANKPLTFDEFVEPLMKDYVKKNEEKKKTVKFEGAPKLDETKFPPNSMAAHLAKARSEAFNTGS